MQTKYRRKIIEQTEEEGAEHTKVVSDEKTQLTPKQALRKDKLRVDP